MAFVSLDGQWLDVNDRLSEMLGYSRDELKSMTIQSVTHPDDRARNQACCECAVSGHAGAGPLQKRYIRKDGEVVWANVMAGVVSGPAGSPDYCLAVIEDVTARIGAETEVRLLRKRMDASTRVQVASLTVRSLAHELNQPLNAVTTNAAAAEYMLASGLNPPELKAALRNCVQQSLRAANVVRDMMALLRTGVSSGEAVDINALICRMVEGAKANSLRKVDFTFDLSPGLSPVRADELQMERVVANLIETGIEAMLAVDMENSAMTVSVSSRAEGQRAHISFADNGIGIPEETSGRVLGPFPAMRTKGLGVRLSVSRSIVEAHGGELWAESSPDAGNIVHFTLPFAE